ncbi:hypothetical protein HYW21_03995 [Candidatus Woesearchaeota archaeon]|nr:hypothetical protein [Candidatus Woesearchaeota archaeon]
MGFIDFLKKRKESSGSTSTSQISATEEGDAGFNLDLPPTPDIDSLEAPQPTSPLTPPPLPEPKRISKPRLQDQQPIPHRGDIPPISVVPRQDVRTSSYQTQHQPQPRIMPTQPRRQEPSFQPPEQEISRQKNALGPEYPQLQESDQDPLSLPENAEDSFMEETEMIDNHEIPQLQVPDPPLQAQRGNVPYVLVPSAVPGQNPIPIVPPSLQKISDVHHKKVARPSSESLDVFSREEDKQEQKGPQFINVNEFRSVLQGIEEGSMLLTKTGDTISHIKNIDAAKEGAIASLKMSLGEIQKRFLVIDGILFREGNG